MLALCGLLVGETGARGQEPERRFVPTSSPRVKMISIPSDSVSYLVGGRVVELETGGPIVGAFVYVRGTASGGQTDRSGRFRLWGFGSDSIDVHLRIVGYVVQCIRVQPSADSMRSLLIGLPPALVANGVQTIVGPCLIPEIDAPPPG